MGKKSNMRSERFNVFFLKPKAGMDIESVAKRLSSRKGVKEVLVTEGRYGFIVKAAEEYREKLLEEISNDYEKVTCCYIYK